jgi:hypothetical protein
MSDGANQARADACDDLRARGLLRNKYDRTDSPYPAWDEAREFEAGTFATLTDTTRYRRLERREPRFRWYPPYEPPDDVHLPADFERWLEFPSEFTAEWSARIALGYPPRDVDPSLPDDGNRDHRAWNGGPPPYARTWPSTGHPRDGGSDRCRGMEPWPEPWSGGDPLLTEYEPPQPAFEATVADLPPMGDPTGAEAQLRALGGDIDPNHGWKRPSGAAERSRDDSEDEGASGLGDHRPVHAWQNADRVWHTSVDAALGAHIGRQELGGKAATERDHLSEGGWHMEWRNPTGFRPGRPKVVPDKIEPETLEQVRRHVGFTRDEFKWLVPGRGKPCPDEDARLRMAQAFAKFAALVEGANTYLAAAYETSDRTVERLVRAGRG